MEGLTIGSIVASVIGSGVFSVIYARHIRKLWELLPWTNVYWLSKMWSYAGGPVGIVIASSRATTGRRDLPEREVAAAAEVYHYLRARNGNVFGNSPSDQPFYGWADLPTEVLERPLLVIIGGPMNNRVAASFLIEFSKQYPAFPLSVKFYTIDGKHEVSPDKIDHGSLGESDYHAIPPSELEQFLELNLKGKKLIWEPGQRKGKDAIPKPERSDFSLVVRCKMPVTGSRQTVIYAAGSSAASTYGAVKALLTPTECRKLTKRASSYGVGAVVETHVVGHYGIWSRVVDESIYPVS